LDLVAAEVKTGRAGGTFFTKQLQKDEDLLLNGRFRKLEYHFLPSGNSGTIGPTRTALDALKALKQRNPGKVEIFIYPPT
jgi:hypothetical protein